MPAAYHRPPAQPRSTLAAYGVAARLMRFIQNRYEFDSIRDNPRHAQAFQEIILWADTQMGHPSIEDMDRWESQLPAPTTGPTK